MKGQWKKGKLIGRGTFGSVYVAFNRETGELCAMKEVDFNPDDPKSAECIKQLEQEIKVLGTLKHPNIVQYYGSEVIDDHFYIYLEYVHSGPINKYVQEHIGTMSESIVRYFTRQILSGLAFLHDTKTTHRDIKAANLLVDTSGVVKLADFGMAKHLNAHSFGLSWKKSPFWMAPEVILALYTDSNPNLDVAVDIWSLGCTIIEMFNGKPPWSECEESQAMFNVLNKSPDIPEALSAEGKEFLSLCFRRSPAERPSAKKLLEHSFLRNSSDQNLSKWLMSINPSTLAINSNHTISLPGSSLYPGMEIEIMKESSCFPLVDKELDLQSQFSGVTVPEVLHYEQQVVHNDPLESKDQCPLNVSKTLDYSTSGSNKANEFDGQPGRSKSLQHFNSEKRCITETQEAKEKERVTFRSKSEVDVMDDGFKWRKYGKKSLRNTPYPRNYYRCAYEGCRVRKRIERDGEDPAFVITEYEGKHNHGGNEKTFVAMGAEESSSQRPRSKTTTAHHCPPGPLRPIDLSFHPST